MYNQKPLLHKKQAEYIPGNLRTISIDTTNKCNMACPHCYASTFRNSPLISLYALGCAITELRGMGVFHWVLQGGEPICDFQRLLNIIAALYPEESYINVVSNGWEMDREKIDTLKAHGVDKIAYSLDSGIESEHDANRGPGSFKKTIQAIKDTLNAGLLSSISTVVTHESLHSDGFRTAFNIAYILKIRFDVQIAEPVGKWDGNTEMLMTKEDSAFIKKMQLESPMLPNGQRMINRDVYSGHYDHCPAGTEFMAISADGNFLPCNFMQFTLGNVADKSCKQMREDLLKCDWFGWSSSPCLCGESKEFIDKYIVPNIDKDKPLDAYKEFKL